MISLVRSNTNTILAIAKMTMTKIAMFVNYGIDPEFIGYIMPAKQIRLPDIFQLYF